MATIAILGAGLTGLSAAYHLGTQYEVFEREAEVGGLCRTMERAGFCFDYTGHLLHLRQDYTKQLIDTFLPKCYQQHTRKARIYLQERYLDYPFQANIHALPPAVIKECLLGFLATLNNNTPAPSASSTPSFRKWVLDTFGVGVARHFMLPYNQKLWRVPLEELAADWVSWSIPKPTLDEFLNGVLGIENRAFGYNPTFLYPRRGGVSQLPQAFARQLDENRLHLNTCAVSIDPVQHLVSFADGSRCHYEHLISTLPLKHLIGLLHAPPPEIAHAAGQLRYVSVYDVNIGIKRPNISDAHWLYFPEPEFPFYRVGFPTNFSDYVAPSGCSSMYVEVSRLPHETIPEAELRDQVCTGLQRCKLLRPSDDILVCDVAHIECAYVIHDLHRARALDIIFPYLQQHNILSAGRYGAWEYSSMESAILAGQSAARSISG